MANPNASLFPFPPDDMFDPSPMGFGAMCGSGPWLDPCALSPFVWYRGFFRFSNGEVAGAALTAANVSATLMTAGLGEDGAGAGLPAGTLLSASDTNSGQDGTPGGDGSFRAYGVMIYPQKPFSIVGGKRQYLADLDRGGAGNSIMSINALLQAAVMENLTASLQYGTSSVKAQYILATSDLAPGYGGTLDSQAKSDNGQPAIPLFKVPTNLGDFRSPNRAKLVLTLDPNVTATPDTGGPAVSVAADVPLIVPVKCTFFGQRLACTTDFMPPCPVPGQQDDWARYQAWRRSQGAQ
jgi:hypothetical protein